MVYRIARCWDRWIFQPDDPSLGGLEYHEDRDQLATNAKRLLREQGGILIIENKDGEEEEKIEFPSPDLDEEVPEGDDS